MLQEALDLLACPRCAGRLGADLRCSSCAAEYGAPGGIPDLRLPADERTETVREFYAQAPFPGYPARDSYGWLRARAGRSELARLLDQAISGDARIVEVGCGTGQMSLFLATADRLMIGVLHHTPDPRASFAAVARLLRPGGTVVIGLYNAFARLPHRLRRGMARLTGFRWIPWDPVLRERSAEPARREAWLRDQYRHVEEHRHTLGEVQGWFRENGVEYLRAYPDTLLAAEQLTGDGLFQAAGDDWPVENVLAQLSWARTLSHEGGLFMVVGRAAAR